jgi:translation initiation factor 3 subunit L
LAAIKLQVMSGNLEEGSKMLSTISHADLIIYSKSGGAY